MIGQTLNTIESTFYIHMKHTKWLHLTRPHVFQDFYPLTPIAAKGLPGCIKELLQNCRILTVACLPKVQEALWITVGRSEGNNAKCEMCQARKACSKWGKICQKLCTLQVISSWSYAIYPYLINHMFKKYWNSTALLLVQINSNFILPSISRAWRQAASTFSGPAGNGARNSYVARRPEGQGVGPKQALPLPGSQVITLNKGTSQNYPRKHGPSSSNHSACWQTENHKQFNKQTINQKQFAHNIKSANKKQPENHTHRINHKHQ